MQRWPSPPHVRWECQDHAVILREDHREVLCGRLQHRVGSILRELCRQRGIALREGPALPDHIHLCLNRL